MTKRPIPNITEKKKEEYRRLDPMVRGVLEDTNQNILGGVYTVGSWFPYYWNLDKNNGVCGKRYFVRLVFDTEGKPKNFLIQGLFERETEDLAEESLRSVLFRTTPKEYTITYSSHPYPR